MTTFEAFVEDALNIPEEEMDDICPFACSSCDDAYQYDECIKCDIAKNEYWNRAE